MGRYLIIDNEEKAVELISESIRSIDSQAQIETFANYTAFEIHAKNSTAEAAAPFWNFDLIIMEYGMHPHHLWNDKIAEIKTKNNKDCNTILVGYENKFTLTKYIRPLDIYNFVFKPFDALILKESLNLALKIKQKAQPLEMKSQSATAFIALLKEVDLQTISELGFVTLSDSQIPAQSVAKFFSSMFLHGKKQSVWAQCLVSIPHPQKAGFFINKFQFIAAEQSLLNTLRKHIVTHKADQTSNALWNLNPPKNITEVRLALIGLDNDENKTMASDLEARFANLKVEIVKLDPQKKSNDQSNYQHHLTLNTTEIKQENYVDLFSKDCIHLWLSQTPLKEDDIKTHAAEYKDIFIKPIDRSYFFKKLKIHCNQLQEKEQSLLLNITSKEIMKVANKVKISEISELYVNLVYNRELPFKDFREFVFLSEDETQNVELPAFCHYTEKSAAAGGGKDEAAGFLHQFVFFAMNDHLLKQIRLWLLHNYIVSNQKND